tara:strand:+ start:69 stop:437 length:369 start_codon:yes stop_codon:yes gene_type:complete
MFDWKKPTVQMLGRWQPWHAGHTELFKKAIKKTGQVAILVRDISDKNNPFEFSQVVVNIRNTLEKEDYKMSEDYIVIKVPNIVDISYGRDVGYSITQHDLGEEVHSISATEIRKDMRDKGQL